MSWEFSSDVVQVETLERRRVAPSSTNLSLADERTTSAEVLALFTRYRERFARTDLPGIVLCFATNSALLKGMLEIAENLLFGDSLLIRRHKEMIATYVSRLQKQPQWQKRRPAGEAWPSRKRSIIQIGAEEGT
jgi:hypothetical protein